MSMSMLSSLDALANWRAGMAASIQRLAAMLGDNGLLEDGGPAQAEALCQRLATDHLVLDLAGPGGQDGQDGSALLGAMLSAGGVHSLLTGMAWPPITCAVELAWNRNTAPILQLLPLHSGTSACSLALLRQQPAQWHTLPLPLDDARALAQALQQLGSTRQVPLDEARALGLWRDDLPAHNPAVDSAGRVTVPTWRQALINYPHPLLQRGLVLRDTAGTPPSARPTLPGDLAGTEPLLRLKRTLLRQLLPQRCQLLTRLVDDCLRSLQQAATRCLVDRQRQTVAQLTDLQQLRNRSSTRMRQLTAQLESESADVEQCTQRLAAVGVVLQRQVQALLGNLSSDTVSAALQRMRDDSTASLFKLGTARAFDRLGQGLQDQLAKAAQALADTDHLLQTSQQALNTEFGSTLACPRSPALAQAQDKLGRIIQSHRRYVGVAQRWRLSQAGFLGRFSAVLQPRLARVFEEAVDDIQAWADRANSQIEAQLQTRRRGLQHWRDTHQRIRSAEDGLLHGIQALQAQQDRQHLLIRQLAAQWAQLHRLVALGPAAADSAAAPAPNPPAATVAAMHPQPQRQAPPQHTPPTAPPALLRRAATLHQASSLA